MYIKLRVVTDTKKEKIVKISEDHFEVWVKEKAERNMANRRVIEVMNSASKIISVGD